MTPKELETLARLLRPRLVYTVGASTNPLVRAVTYTSLPEPPVRPYPAGLPPGLEIEDVEYPPGYPNNCPPGYTNGLETWTAPDGRTAWKFFAAESKWRVVWVKGDPDRRKLKP